MDLQKEIEELKAMVLLLTKPIVQPTMEEQAEIIESLRKSCYEYNLANQGRTTTE